MDVLKEEKYYLYAYLDPRKPGVFAYEGIETTFDYEPFYIGKGCGDRWKAHLLPSCAGVNNHKDRKISKIKNMQLEIPIVRFAWTNNESEAYALEYDVIATIGRSCVNFGPLTNLEEGGLGGRIMSEETKTKISLANSGKIRTPAMRENISKARTGLKLSAESKEGKLATRWDRYPPPMLGKTHTEGTKQLFRELAKNRTPEHIAKIVVALTGRPMSTTAYEKLRAYQKTHDNPNKGKVLNPYELYQHRLLHTKYRYKIMILSSNETFYTYCLTELIVKYGIDIGTLHRTFTGKALQHKGLKIIEKEPLLPRWYQDSTLLTEYKTLHPYKESEVTLKES